MTSSSLGAVLGLGIGSGLALVAALPVILVSLVIVYFACKRAAKTGNATSGTLLFVVIHAVMLAIACAFFAATGVLTAASIFTGLPAFIISVLIAHFACRKAAATGSAKSGTIRYVVIRVVLAILAFLFFGLVFGSAAHAASRPVKTTFGDIAYPAKIQGNYVVGKVKAAGETRTARLDVSFCRGTDDGYIYFDLGNIRKYRGNLQQQMEVRRDASTDDAFAELARAMCGTMER